MTIYLFYQSYEPTRQKKSELDTHDRSLAWWATHADSLRRRIRRAGLLTAMLTVCIGIPVLVVVWLIPLPDLLLIQNIKNGMTEADVVAIFGTKPTSGQPYQVATLVPPRSSHGTPKYWYCDAGIAEVLFGTEGRVISCTYFSYGFTEHPLKTKLRILLSWVGLSWLIR